MDRQKDLQILCAEVLPLMEQIREALKQHHIYGEATVHLDVDGSMQFWVPDEVRMRKASDKVTLSYVYPEEELLAHARKE